MTRKSEAEAFIIAIDRKRSILHNDERANAAYWNGDNWGGIEGTEAARRWFRNALGRYAMRRALAIAGNPPMTKAERAVVLSAVKHAHRLEKNIGIIGGRSVAGTKARDNVRLLESVIRKLTPRKKR